MRVLAKVRRSLVPGRQHFGRSKADIWDSCTDRRLANRFREDDISVAAGKAGQSKKMESQTGEVSPTMQAVVHNQGSVHRRTENSDGKAAYCAIALRNATSKIDALEKDMIEMRSIMGEHEKRRREAEAKAAIAQRKAQDSEIRFNISDKRRKDAEERTSELEVQIIDAISLARKFELLGTDPATEEANRFDRLRGIFDNQAFEENKKRIDAEQRAYEVMKKRAEAEAKCLEEIEKRVQAEIHAKQEMRIRIDEDIKNKALRSKLKDIEEKLKICETQKRAEADNTLKAMLKRAQHSLSQTEQKRKDAEGKVLELEQQVSFVEAKALEYERQLDDKNNRVEGLQMLLDQSRVDFEKRLEYSLIQLESSTKRVKELQQVLENTTVPHDIKSSKRTFFLGKLYDNGHPMGACIPEEEDNNMKLGELQTINADLEVKVRELKEQMHQKEHDGLNISNLLTQNARLEASIEELNQRLEQEDCAKVQLHATIEELEDTLRMQNQKLEQIKAFESSLECRRLGDSLIALHVEENPLFRPEPVNDGSQRNCLSRPDSVTDDSQTSPRERPDSITCQSQQISVSSPAMVMVSRDAETKLIENPKFDTEDCDDPLYGREKQRLHQKLKEKETLIADLSGSIHESGNKQSELEIQLKEALQCKESAELKANALMRQLEVALQLGKKRETDFKESIHNREAAEFKADTLKNQLELALRRDREKDKEYEELSGTTSLRGKKEKWGILDRFRSKIKPDNA